MRLLIVAEDAQQEAEMVWRARAARRLVSDEELVMYGAAFRSGALCQAGGFVGDGHRSVRERLGAIGFGPVATLSPRPRPDAMRADRQVPVSA